MQVILTPKALKYFKHLPKIEQKKVKKKMEILETDSFAGKKLSGILEELRSFKVWPYRIIYYIDNPEKKVYIVAILHRQGAYK